MLGGIKRGICFCFEEERKEGRGREMSEEKGRNEKRGEDRR